MTFGKDIFTNMKENQFQQFLKGRLRAEFPECVILKNDPTYLQGVPDLLVLEGNRWAALECKASEGASLRPNQQYYLDRLNKMAFAALVYPENVEQVLDELSLWFVHGLGGHCE